MSLIMKIYFWNLFIDALSIYGQSQASQRHACQVFDEIPHPNKDGRDAAWKSDSESQWRNPMWWNKENQYQFIS